jgi:hypothetical protein
MFIKIGKQDKWPTDTTDMRVFGKTFAELTQISDVSLMKEQFVVSLINKHLSPPCFYESLRRSNFWWLQDFDRKHMCNQTV